MKALPLRRIRVGASSPRSVPDETIVITQVSDRIVVILLDDDGERGPPLDRFGFYSQFQLRSHDHSQRDLHTFHGALGAIIAHKEDKGVWSTIVSLITSQDLRMKPLEDPDSPSSSPVSVR